jgi:hypothetical protein
LLAQRANERRGYADSGIDLDLGHGFHQTKPGLRYTISEAAAGMSSVAC